MAYYGHGTLTEYNADDLLAKKDAGWTDDEIENGKTNYNAANLEPNPNAQKTLNVLSKFQNPDGSNEYVWNGGDELTQSEYDTIIDQWFPPDDLEEDQQEEDVP